MKKILFAATLISLFACSASKQSVSTKKSTFRSFAITGISTDRTYGLSEKNPVEVGGSETSSGPINERRYLDALAGPNGEQISYYRAGSCCAIKSDNDPFGFGSVMLDNYRVTWDGSKDTVSIYINMYDYGELKAPVGFTVK